MKNNVLYVIIVILLLAVGFLYLSLRTANSQKSTYTSTVAPTTVVSQNSVPVSAPKQQYSSPIFNSGTTYKLASLPTYSSSFVLSGFTLPLNASNITITGSFTSSNRIQGALLNEFQLGEIGGIAASANSAVQANQIAIIMHGGAGYVNGTSGNFAINLYSTYGVYQGRPGVYNFTCTNWYFACPIQGTASIQYYLVFVNLNQTTNSTMTIGKTIAVNYVR